MPKITSEDAKWQREDDARTLARAEEIKADKGRMKGAVKQAGVMAKEKEKEAAAIKRIAASEKSTKKSTKQ